MSVYDKVPEGGTFRAALNADWADADCNKVFAVALNASGRVVKSDATNTNTVGLIVIRGTYDNTGVLRGPKAGTIVDVMKRGEIVEITDAEFGGTALAAGQEIKVITADGTLSAVTGTGVRVGHTVEATRLVVNVTT